MAFLGRVWMKVRSLIRHAPAQAAQIWTTATPEEIELCIGAISRHPKGASEIIRPPGHVHVLETSEGRWVCIAFVAPATLPLGSVYRSWVVQLVREAEPVVAFVRSRRGISGDETLPPD